MEALLESLAMKYGMEKAIQLLGIDKQTQNPKYAISMGGNTLDIGNMAKRVGLNQGIKSLTGGKLGGMLGPGLLLGGALMLGRTFDPTRPGSRNYNPALKSQMNYLNFNNMIGPNQSSGLTQYGPESVLSGQNVVSMFGTNDYEKQLNKYKDKYYDTMSDKRKDKLDKEIGNIQDYNVQKTIEKNQLRNLQNINAGGDGGGSAQTSGYSNTDGGPVSNKTGRGRTGYGKGGIASL
jgi:hypothetical protein